MKSQPKPKKTRKSGLFQPFDSVSYENQEKIEENGQTPSIIYNNTNEVLLTLSYSIKNPSSFPLSIDEKNSKKPFTVFDDSESEVALMLTNKREGFPLIDNFSNSSISNISESSNLMRYAKTEKKFE